MIPNAEKTVEVQSNITGESGQFTVDESALGHIMDVLTNLYSDPEGAVTREYLTNAFDAQVEAGMKPGTPSWTPIKVTTPSHFNKSYIIRDFGVGMDANDLSETYSKYGKSTKTTSNDVVGMLGLGSKCALTYTNSFTITGWKNGVKTMAIVSKNEENIPVFHVVHESPSDEPNGVEISVPVKDRNSFTEKTAALLRWWAPGLVEVNGVAPKAHSYPKVHDAKINYVVAGEPVVGDSEVYLISGLSRWDNNNSYIIMGNVPYAVSNEYVPSELSDNGMGFVAYVPMGAVNFPPSRETLYFNAMTKNVISQISNGLFKSILKAKLKEVTDSPDHITAHKTYYAMPYAFKNTPEYRTLTYKGDAFTERIKHEHMVLDWDWKGNGQIAEREWLHLSNAMSGTNGDARALVITGCDLMKKPTAYFKKKVRHWMRENGHHYEMAFLVEDDIDSIWLDSLTRIDFDTIKAIKLPKDTTNNGPRAAATYDIYFKETDSTSGVTTVKHDDVEKISKKGARIVFVSPSDMRETYRKSGTTPDVVMKYLPDDVVLVVLAANRFDKFQRLYPKAVPLRTVWKETLEGLVKSITDHEYMVERLDYNERKFLNDVDPTTLSDPDLVDLCKIVKNTGNVQNLANAEQMARFGPRCGIVESVPTRKDVENIVKTRYPLIGGSSIRNMRHLTLYANAVWSEYHAPKP